LQIIHEYDLRVGKKYPPETVEARVLYATRYLQTRTHKQGKTSGDGRSIWNGVLADQQLDLCISIGEPAQRF